MKRILIRLLCVIGLFTGAIMVVWSLIVFFSFGALLKLSHTEPEQAIVVDSREIASPDYQDRLLELHGVLESSEVLDLPEYGIRLKAVALWADARVWRASSEPPHDASWVPLSGAAPGAALTADQCPAGAYWSQSLRLGSYSIDSGLIAELLHTRSRVGFVCERSFLPLPPEHIHLPASLRGMARILPQQQRVDCPDCTIYRLAERYCNPDIPTEPTQEGDVELRFSYLPAEIPAAVRGRYYAGRISKLSSGETAFAANGTQLPPVESPPAMLLTGMLFVSMLFFPFFFLLSGISLFSVCLQQMCGVCKPFRLGKTLLATLALLFLAVTAGWLSDFFN